MVNIIILSVIVIYLLFVICTGVFIGKKTKQNSEGFFLGGRGMGPLVTAMSAEASDTSSYLLMGIPGLAYLTGLADPCWTAIGLVVGTYLNFRLISKRLRRYSEKIGAITIPDFFSKRFEEGTNVIEAIAAVIIIVFFIPYVASGLQAIGKLFNTVFETNYMTGVFVGSIVILSYSVLGGFGSVAIMDLIQSIIMTFALVVIIIFAVDKAGGLVNVISFAKSLPGFLSLTHSHVPAESVGELGTMKLYGPIKILSTLAWGLGYFGMPHILVRFMSIRDESELKLSRRIASTWIVISMIVAIFIGMTGLAMSYGGSIPYLKGSDTERVIIRIADLLAEVGVVPAIIAGIILAGALAATMSTADSQLLCAASSFSQNILQNTFKKKMNDKQQMLSARLTILVILILAIFIASDPDSPIGQSIFQVVSFAWAGFGACFGPAMVLALFSKKTNAKGVISGMVVGGITIFIWKFVVRQLGGIYDIYELLPAFILNIVITLLVSRFTTPPSENIQRTFEEVMTNI